MINDYKITNMNEGLRIRPESPDQNYRMIKTLQIMNGDYLNESVDNSIDSKAVTCPICGASWVPKVHMGDGTTQICPVCDNIVNPEAVNLMDPSIEDELTADTKVDLEQTFDEYIDCVNCDDAEGAKAILESANAIAMCKPLAGNGLEVMLEKFVIKVDANGNKQKVKVRTGKAKKLSAKQKAALKKARKKANTGAAKKARKKAMKARARMGLNKKVNEAMEAFNNLPSASDLQNAVENVLNNQGIEVINSANENSEGITAVSVDVVEPTVDISLEDIISEIEGMLPGFEIDYDDPEVDPSDNTVNLVFYFTSTDQTNEATNCRKRRMNEYDDEDDILECDDYEDMMSERKNCKKKKACNESFSRYRRSRRMNESASRRRVRRSRCNESMELAGGEDNIRCKIHPAFIKAGQVIYDVDEDTVFTALTEPVDYNGEFALEVDIEDSNNPDLKDLAPGSEISLNTAGEYYLLKDNPIM